MRTPGPNDTAERFSKRLGVHYKKYVLITLLIVYIFNFIDRQILTILVQPIKEEFGVSDTAMGFLTGTAFALFYATLGIPIARLADKYTRRTIVAIALALWSAMTALSGMVTSFLQMAICRIGVAVGEAGASPPIHSMLADYFKPGQRATALAFYSMGIPIGSTLGIMLGGWISETWDWRTAFFIVGIPGLLLSIVVLLTIREPKRGESEEGERQARQDETPPVPLARVMQVLKKQKSFFHMSMGTSLHAFVGYGLAAFNPAFIERVFEVPRSEIGVKLGLLLGITGAAGVMMGGWVTDKLSIYDRRWYMWIPSLAMLLSMPFYIAAYLAESFTLFLVFYALPSFMGNLQSGPVFATAQGLVPLGMRAVTAAILLFIVNIIGLGLGPQIVGIVSDVINYFQYDGNNEGKALQYALLFACFAKIASSTHYYIASRTLRRDLDEVQQIEADLAKAEPAGG